MDTPERKPPHKRSRFWRKCRIAFRRFRITVLLLILALVGALVYLNQIGLPGFIKRPVLESLRARGLDLRFSRLRWGWDRGIVAEKVRFGRTGDPTSPKLSLQEVRVQLDYRALLRFQFQVKSLTLRQGQLAWPVIEPNAPNRTLTVDNIQSDLRFLPDDCWQLDHFQAEFAGARIRLTGTVTNASEIRNWTAFQASRQPSAALGQQRLRRLADILNNVHFATPPDLIVSVHGDARDAQSFEVQLQLQAPDAETRWGNFQNGMFNARLGPAEETNTTAEMRLQATHIDTRWATASNPDISLHLSSDGSTTNPVNAVLNISAGRIETGWGKADRAHLAAQWLQSPTNATPLSGHAELQMDQIATTRGGARTLQLSANFLPPTVAPSPESSWAWWTNLAPFTLDWETHVSGLQSSNLDAAEIVCAGNWSAPELNVTQLLARVYHGQLNARAALNVDSRELNFSGSSDFDVRKISGLLTPHSRQWLSQFTWKTSPALQAEGSLTLPAWTNRHPEWNANIKPTVRLTGHVHLDEGAFREIPVSAADSHFSYSNEIWRLPDLVVTRPEGRLEIAHQSNQRTEAYHFKIHSTADPRALLPLLNPEAQRAFDLARFSQPPVVDGEIWGYWHEPDRIGARAHIALTNFAFRGESADDVEAQIEYTNRFLTITEPRLHHGTQFLSAQSLKIDFDADKIYLTNGYGTADMGMITRAIGPHIAAIMEPYHCLEPATARINGVIPMKHEEDADLHFEVRDGTLQWQWFRASHVTGKIDWTGKFLNLRDVRAQFYGGSLVANAAFDFRPPLGADMQFEVTAENADLHELANDYGAKTNRLEGLLTVRLGVAHANSTDWRTCQGGGRVLLRNGLIWDIPVFGFFSPVLDSIVPGLGNSRASELSATFSITNGVAHSSDLEVRATGMRLAYWGSVDFAGRVNARAQAELFRDTRLVGRALSFALWPVSKALEYKITGTIQKPKSEPLFIPKLLLVPLHPFKSIKGLIPEPPDYSQTNSPSSLLEYAPLDPATK